MYKLWKSINTSETEPCVCVKHMVGQIIPQATTIQKAVIDDIINAVDGFEPGITMSSANWKHWVAQLDLYTCKHCRKMHGQVYSAETILLEGVDGPPVHDRCRCIVETLMAVAAGYATRNGFEGADYWLQKYGILPDKYIGKKEAKELGWVSVLGNLDEVAPGKMIGGDIYRNRNGHLPKADGRIWYEADINYTGGYRSRHRILYSNDGLIFVTYDHYETFAEIV